MSECTRCGREHVVPRRIPVGLLAINQDPGAYVVRPEVWPGFLAWFREKWPEATKDRTDEQVFQNVKHAVQVMMDFLAIYGKVPASEYLVLRDIRLADMAQHLTVASDDPPGVMSIGTSDDCGVTAHGMWLITRSDARDLIAAVRDRLGEPDIDALADAEGSEKMQHVFEKHVIHTHRED